MADLLALLLIVAAVTAVAVVLRAILRPLERIALAACGGAVALAQGRKQKAAAKAPFLCTLSAEDLHRASLEDATGLVTWGPLRPFAWYRPRYGEDADQEPEFRTTIPPPGHGWIPVPGLIRDEPEDWAALCKNS